MNLADIQRALADAGLDAWLFYDFRGSDPLARSILGLRPGAIQTRRWFYLIPADGQPIRLVHAIETGALDDLPGEKRVYLAWQKLRDSLAEMVRPHRRIAMQYSPGNAIPYISRVDAGTVELIRSFGAEVVTSADLVQRFEATMTDAQYQSHCEAANLLGELVVETFAKIGADIRAGRPVNEFSVQSFMLDFLRAHDLFTDHPPIVAVDANAANPHYAPSESQFAPIKPGCLVLLDLWAKKTTPGSIFGDITWCGYVGDKVPAEIAKVSEIVRAARDAAIAAVTDAQKEKRPIRGCEVDDICRNVIVKAGYGEYFIHRTGHSIHEMGHGNGANIDNLETQDERRLIPRTCFSIEPGIYLPGRFGVRSEVNVYLPDESSAIVTGPAPQTELVLIQ